MTVNRDLEVGDLMSRFHRSTMDSHELYEELRRLGIWEDQADLMAFEAEKERKEVREKRIDVE